MRVLLKRIDRLLQHLDPVVSMAQHRVAIHAEDEPHLAAVMAVIDLRAFLTPVVGLANPTYVMLFEH